MEPTDTKQILQLHLLPTGELKFDGSDSMESVEGLQAALDTAQSIIRTQEIIKQKYKWNYMVQVALALSLLTFGVGSLSFVFARSVSGGK